MIMSGSSADFLQKLLENSRVVKMEYDQDVFEVKLDVEKYEPNELSVKVKNDHLIISGQQENKSHELGLVAQQFTRQFLMPEDINLDTLSSTLSPEGILTVRALVKSDVRSESTDIDIENNIGSRGSKQQTECNNSELNQDLNVGRIGIDEVCMNNNNNSNSNNNNNNSCMTRNDENDKETNVS